jgi:ferrous iron transport protein B
MSIASPTQTLTIALVGNPNTGKSTLFNGLSGLRQRVGNYPGVTVEKKIGRYEYQGQSFTLIDLPGTYSLAPRSPDEMIAVDVLLGRRDDVHSPQAVLCIVDASNLERHLYLVSQVLELGLPVVIALNMVDVARERGIAVNAELLAERLRVPVVVVQANRQVGLTALKDAIAKAAVAAAPPLVSPFPEAFQQEVEQLGAVLRRDHAKADAAHDWPRYLVERLLLDTSGYLASTQLAGHHRDATALVAAARERLKTAGCPVPGVEPVSRYRWVGEVLSGVVTRPRDRKRTLSDAIDAVLTHRIAGAVVFVVLMAFMFRCVFWIAEPASQLIDALNALLAMWVTAFVPEGQLRSLLIDGVIAGVGGVLVFLPQIFLLFLFIGVLEDCGYMSRAAYLMDKLMSRVGLSGKSFIPLLSSFACAIPGIMAARVIENRRDRLVTILVAPLMTCSARLPVYVLLVSAFIPPLTFLNGWVHLRDLTMLSMYLLGIVAAVTVAFVLKSTILRGPTPPFVMELPSYKLPSPGTVLWRMLENGREFVYRAGTLILAVSIIVWALAYYPRHEGDLDPALVAAQASQAERVEELQASGDQEALAAAEATLQATDNLIAGAHLQNSYLGRAGKFIEPAVKPLGWDWRIGCAAIASFPAREVVIATLGVIYNLGSDVDEGSTPLRDTLAAATWEGTERKVFNVPVALSVMVFFALCAQCSSTLAIMKRETNSWRWPLFTFVYMTTLAYLGALATYQIGIRLLGG